MIGVAAQTNVAAGNSDVVEVAVVKSTDVSRVAVAWIE
jgi:hypothetical protein